MKARSECLKGMICVVLVVTLSVLAYAGDNLLKNGDFQNGIEGGSFLRMVKDSNGKDKVERDNSVLSWETEDGVEGKKGCLHYKLTSDKAGTGFSYETGATKDVKDSPYAIPAGKTVKVSCYAKSLSGTTYITLSMHGGVGKDISSYPVFELPEGQWIKCETTIEPQKYDKGGPIISIVKDKDNGMIKSESGDILIDGICLEIIK